MNEPHASFRTTRTIFLAVCFVARGFAATPEQAPEFEWATSAGGLRNDKTRAINIDREGNVFLSGEVTDEVKCGGTALKSAGGRDFVCAKLDAKGKVRYYADCVKN